LKRRTIREAIIETFKRVNRTLSARDIFDYIIEQDLYRFNAENPEGIVRVEIRRHCEGVEFPSAKPTKYFRILKDGKYWLKGFPIPGISEKELKSEKIIQQDANNLKVIGSDLIKIHAKHIEAIRKQILNNLKELQPVEFEIFSKKLLEIYGFREMSVTPPSKDGGIDGRGKLKVGITFLDVAFQSKRWNKTAVSQKEIQTFRGSIQGKCEQGIYFTTSTYTKGAKEVSLQKGAVPVILIDGELIVDLMIEKGLGVETESLKMYSINFENIFIDED